MTTSAKNHTFIANCFTYSTSNSLTFFLYYVAKNFSRRKKHHITARFIFYDYFQLFILPIILTLISLLIYLFGPHCAVHKHSSNALTVALWNAQRCSKCFTLMFMLQFLLCSGVYCCSFVCACLKVVALKCWQLYSKMLSIFDCARTSKVIIIIKFLLNSFTA